MEIKEFTRKPVNKVPTEQHDERVRKLRKEHEKIVKGKFEFTDANGGWIDFTYRFFKGDPIMTIKLIHGEVVDLPLGLVRHINNTTKKVRKMKNVISSPSEKSYENTSEITSRIKFVPIDMF